MVVLCCALNDETRGMADKIFFDRMKSSGILVNVGRGDLLDEQALISALNTGSIDYAILDVFETEPLPESSTIWDHPLIQVTPHSSSRGTMTDPLFDRLFLDNLRAYLAGGEVRNRVLPGSSLLSNQG